MNKRAGFFIIMFVFGVFNLGCSKKVAPPPESLEGWRYIFSFPPDTTASTPIDTIKFTPQRIEQ